MTSDGSPGPAASSSAQRPAQVTPKTLEFNLPAGCHAAVISWLQVGVYVSALSRPIDSMDVNNAAGSNCLLTRKQRSVITGPAR